MGKLSTKLLTLALTLTSSIVMASENYAVRLNSQNDACPQISSVEIVTAEDSMELKSAALILADGQKIKAVASYHSVMCQSDMLCPASDSVDLEKTSSVKYAEFVHNDDGSYPTTYKSGFSQLLIVLGSSEKETFCSYSLLASEK